jgi:hypothetical protein
MQEYAFTAILQNPFFGVRDQHSTNPPPIFNPIQTARYFAQLPAVHVFNRFEILSEFFRFFNV